MSGAERVVPRKECSRSKIVCWLVSERVLTPQGTELSVRYLRIIAVCSVWHNLE